MILLRGNYFLILKLKKRDFVMKMGVLKYVVSNEERLNRPPL